MRFSDSTASVSVDDSFNSESSTKTNTDRTDSDECNIGDDGAYTNGDPLSSSEQSWFSGFDRVLSRLSVGKNNHASSIVAQNCNGSCAGCTFETRMELKLVENINVVQAPLFDNVFLDRASDDNYDVLSPQPVNFNMYETVFEVEEDDWEWSSVNSEFMVDKSKETIESEHQNVDFHSTPKTLSDESVKICSQLVFVTDRSFTGFISDPNIENNLIKINEIIQENNVTQSLSNASEQSVQTDSWHSTSVVIDAEVVTLNVKSNDVIPDNEFIRHTLSKGPIIELPNVRNEILQRLSSKRGGYQST